MDKCERFLASQKPWIRSVLNGEYGESREILPGLSEPGGIEALNKARDEYEEVLKHCPEHLRKYRKDLRKLGSESSLSTVASLPVGRPRQDSLAQEAEELERAGLSQPKIALELNRRHPDRKDRRGNLSPVTEGAVRKMLARRRENSPDKT